MWKIVGYCPWCGNECQVMCYSPQLEQWDWYPCTTPRCKGAFIKVVTDGMGFIIHPKRKRGSFMLSRPWDVYEKWQRDEESLEGFSKV
jgi:hypothetical protein